MLLSWNLLIFRVKNQEIVTGLRAFDGFTEDQICMALLVTKIIPNIAGADLALWNGPDGQTMLTEMTNLCDSCRNFEPADRPMMQDKFPQRSAA